MTKTSDESNSDPKSRLPLYLSIVLVGGVVASYFLVPEVKDFFNEAWNVLTSDDEKRIQDWVSGFGWFGPILLILAMIVQMFLLIVPSVLLMVVSVLAYGPIWGSILIFAAIFTASSVGYFIGRYFGELFVARLLGQKTENKMEDFIDDYGFWAVIVTRINPFLSNDAISFVGGLLQMGYWKFIGATMVGIAPLTILIAILGKSTDRLQTGLLWGSLISLVAFGIYIWWDKRKKSDSAG
ncbi:MAG: TVP38/TMEM64 family protein [Pricia sp.]